jgi:D-alanine transaminase
MDEQLVFFNGQILPLSQVRISPDDRGFNFADGVYEVLRFYKGQLFFASQHLERLKRSLAELKINYPEVNAVNNIIENLLEVNNLQQTDGLAYIQITRGDFPRIHQFPPANTPPTVYINVKEWKAFDLTKSQSIKAITFSDMRWGRCDIKSIALLPNIMSFQNALEHGAGEAIFIRDGVITEGSRTNIFGVKNGIVYTHPFSNSILPGITRQIVLDICEKENLKVLLFPIAESAISSFDEFFLTGTSPEISGICQINALKIGNGETGPITRFLQQEFEKLKAK